MLGRRRQTHKSACCVLNVFLCSSKKRRGRCCRLNCLMPSMDDYEKRATRCWTALLHVKRSVWCVWFVVVLRWCCCVNAAKKQEGKSSNGHSLAMRASEISFAPCSAEALWVALSLQPACNDQDKESAAQAHKRHKHEKGK